MTFYNQTIDKKGLKRIISWFLENYGPTRTSELIESLKVLGFHYATRAGLSLGFDDLRIPFTKNILLEAAQKQVQKCEQNYLRGSITSLERYQKLIDIWTTTSENLKEEVIQNFQRTPLNPLYMMAFSGARGNISQVRQLVGMRGLMSDSGGGIIDFPIRSNFREGLSVTEYVISCYGARKGLIDTALRTADSGYLTRRLVDVAHGILIGEMDCLTPFSLSVPLSEKHILGRVLAENLGVLRTPNQAEPTSIFAWKNQDISSSLSTEILARISDKRSEIRVRSPLTCGTVRQSNCGFAEIADEPELVRSALGRAPLAHEGGPTPVLAGYSGGSLSERQPEPAHATWAEPKLARASLEWPIEDRTAGGSSGHSSLQSKPNLAEPYWSERSSSERSADHSEALCQLCYGWNLSQGRLVSIGDAVGIIAAQSIGEPGTQLTMRTFHTGGIFSTDVQDKIFAPHDGIVSIQASLASSVHSSGSAWTEPLVASGKLGLNADSFVPAQPIRGCKVRSVHGETGFLCFEAIQMRIEFSSTSDSTHAVQTFSSILRLPPQTLLFVYPGKFIQKNTLCAEISRVRASFPPSSTQPDEETSVHRGSNPTHELSEVDPSKVGAAASGPPPEWASENRRLRGAALRADQGADFARTNRTEHALIEPASTNVKNVLSEIQGQVVLASQITPGSRQEVWVLAAQKFEQQSFQSVFDSSFDSVQFARPNGQAKLGLASLGPKSVIWPGAAQPIKRSLITASPACSELRSEHATASSKRPSGVGPSSARPLATFGSPGTISRVLNQSFQKGDLVFWTGYRFADSSAELRSAIDPSEVGSSSSARAEPAWPSEARTNNLRFIEPAVRRPRGRSPRWPVFPREPEVTRGQQEPEVACGRVELDPTAGGIGPISLGHSQPSVLARGERSSPMWTEPTSTFSSRCTNTSRSVRSFRPSVHRKTFEVTSLAHNGVLSKSPTILARIPLANSDGGSEPEPLGDSSASGLLITYSDLKSVEWSVRPPDQLYLDQSPANGSTQRSLFSAEPNEKQIFCQLNTAQAPPEWTSGARANLAYPLGELLRNGNELEYTAQVIRKKYRMSSRFGLRRKGLWDKQSLTYDPRLFRPSIHQAQPFKQSLIFRRVQPHLFSGSQLTENQAELDSSSCENAAGRLRMAEQSSEHVGEISFSRRMKSRPLNLRPVGTVVQERDMLFQLSIPLEQSKTGDIVQGLPKIEQLFEGRGGSLFDETADQTLASYLSGAPITQEKFLRAPLPTAESGGAQWTESRNVPGALTHSAAQSADFVAGSERSSATRAKPVREHVEGFQVRNAFGLDPAQKRFILQRRLVDEIQAVYQSQGVEIADKHVEIIVRQMTSKVKILEKGNTPFFPDDIVAFENLREVNPEHIFYEPIILGITKVAFYSNSFISAASFQETKRVLLSAAIQTRVDHLFGLKENVILGRLIPAGTGSIRT